MNTEVLLIVLGVIVAILVIAALTKRRPRRRGTGGLKVNRTLPSKKR